MIGRKMNNIIENNDDQFANGQVSCDLRGNVRQRRGSQFLPRQIDADERLPGYLREPHLPRFESRSARNFAKQRVHRGDPRSVLPGSQSIADQFRRTSESDAALHRRHTTEPE